MLEETVTISKKEYRKLLDDSLLLSYLDKAGVDNWDWYGDVIEEYEQDKILHEALWSR